MGFKARGTKWAVITENGKYLSGPDKGISWTRDADLATRCAFTLGGYAVDANALAKLVKDGLDVTKLANGEYDKILKKD